jgi:hypothetical protein
MSTEELIEQEPPILTEVRLDSPPTTLTPDQKRELSFYELLEDGLTAEERSKFIKMRIEVAHSIRSLFYQL